MKGWNWEGFASYLVNPYLLEGVFTTVWLTAAAIVFGLIIGMIVAMMRMSSNPALVGFARGYTWLFRGTPLLVQLIIIYTGLPQMGLRLNVVTSALLALSLNEGAYLAELIRAGIQAVPKGQTDAARSLGMKSWMTMRLIILPQTMRIIIPPLGNSINGMLKTSSITSVISMEELMRRSQVLMQERFLVLEIFTVAAVYYLALTTLWELVQHRLEKHYGKGYGGLESTQDRA